MDDTARTIPSSASNVLLPNVRARARALLKSVRPQAKKRRRNRAENRSGRIRHGPTFRFLARPREEVMIDVEG